MATKISPVIRALKMHIFKNKELRKSFNFVYKSQKYEIEEILKNILYVNKTGISWRSIISKIHYSTIYKAFKKLSSYGIFEMSYSSLLKKYFKKTPAKKLRCILTDTTFIQNKNGKTLIGYNPHYSRKKGTKISTVTDSEGITINMKLYSGNQNDATILLDHLEQKPLIGQDILSRYTKFFLADKGYDTTKIKEKLKELKMIPIIAQNKRNIKDKKLLKELTKEEKKIYKKRIKIEHSYKTLKNFRRIDTRHDSYEDSYKSFVYLALFEILFKKMSPS
jgi:transposase